VSGSFLDTTVLMNLSQSAEPARSDSQSFVNANQPSEVAFYASRELLTGPVRYICDAHNALLAAQDHGEAIVALGQRLIAARRWRDTAIQIIAQNLHDILDSRGAQSAADLKREGLQAISIKATQLWRRANSPKNVTRVQPLGCFNGGDISYGPGGELQGPNDSFNCASAERCAAAGWIHDDQGALSKLIDALRPSKLDAKAKVKNENTQRRKALKELKRLGPKDFSKRRCRALGDAYFAVMCPSGSVIATTNIIDFQPLCSALGKLARQP
jgi:hypothetical protein